MKIYIYIRHITSIIIVDSEVVADSVNNTALLTDLEICFLGLSTFGKKKKH